MALAALATSEGEMDTRLATFTPVMKVLKGNVVVLRLFIIVGTLMESHSGSKKMFTLFCMGAIFISFHPETNTELRLAEYRGADGSRVFM